MLKSREECDTYLTHICRHQCSRESPVTRWNIRSFQPTLRLSSAVDIVSNVYRCESESCHTLPFFLTFFILRVWRRRLLASVEIEIEMICTHFLNLQILVDWVNFSIYESNCFREAFSQFKFRQFELRIERRVS